MCVCLCCRRMHCPIFISLAGGEKMVVKFGFNTMKCYAVSRTFENVYASMFIWRWFQRNSTGTMIRNLPLKNHPTQIHFTFACSLFWFRCELSAEWLLLQVTVLFFFAFLYTNYYTKSPRSALSKYHKILLLFSR